MAVVAFASRHAGFTGLGALFAMRIVVLGAFVVALLANLDALLKHVHGVVGTSGDERGGEAANIGTVAVEPNAGHHYLDVGFIKTGIGAQLAGGNAAAEGIEYGAVIGAGAGDGSGHLHRKGD